MSDCQHAKHVPSCDDWVNLVQEKKSIEQKLRVAAEENLRLRIDASKGLYTPTKEAEYERMKAQLRVAREGLEAIARKGDGIKSDMIDWANIGKNSKDEAREVLKKIK